MKKSIIALICMIVTLVFIIVALIGPWYSMSYKIEGTGISDSEMDYSSTLTSSSGKNPFTGKEESQSHADARKEAEDMGSDTGVFDVYDNTLYITIIALIVAILGLIGILGFVFNFGKPKTMKMIGSIFIILTIILSFVAVFYFMTAFTEEANLQTIEGKDAGFWYSESKSQGSAEMTYSAGPGFGWYLMLIGAILAIISIIFVFMDKKSSPMPSNPMQQQPRPPQ